MKMKKISFFDYFGKDIIMRSAMCAFINDIEKSKEKKIVLDFRKIKFISRSCADEYIKFLNETDKEIKEINLSSDVSNMLQVVKSGLSITFDSPSKVERKVLCN